MLVPVIGRTPPIESREGERSSACGCVCNSPKARCQQSFSTFQTSVNATELPVHARAPPRARARVRATPRPATVRARASTSHHPCPSLERLAPVTNVRPVASWSGHARPEHPRPPSQSTSQNAVRTARFSPRRLHAQHHADARFRSGTSMNPHSPARRDDRKAGPSAVLPMATTYCGSARA